MTDYLVCGQCGHDCPVSSEDPDSTVSDMADHVRMRHGAGPAQAMNSIHLIQKETP